MLNLRLEEITVVALLTLLHFGFYQQFNQAVAVEKAKPKPIFIEFIKPKPEPKVEEPKPKLIEAPPKPKEPPKPQKPKVVKPKKVVVKKPVVKKVVEKPKLQQESVVKVHAEEVVEKEVVERPQQISEPVVKKPDNKPEVKEEPDEPPEPPHVPVITPVGGTRGCASKLDYYPPEAREQGLEGTVKVKIQVSADGNVTGATIAKSSGHSILDESVLSKIYDCNLEPAEKDGVPISSKAIIPVRFKLD